MSHKHRWQYVSSEDIYKPNGRTYKLYGYDGLVFEIPMQNKAGTILKFVCECGMVKTVGEETDEERTHSSHES